MKRTHWALSAALAAILSGGGAQSQGQDAPPDAGALFQKLDKNGDGKLTASEIPEDQIRFFERLVRKGDKNADGELTREEFEQASKPEERPNVPLGGGERGPGDARQRFEMLDRNKDGKITLDEVPEQFRERIKPIFDRTGKQELTFEEFSRLTGGGPPQEPGEMFARLDANGDGKLTVDEVPERVRPMLEGLLRRVSKEKGVDVTAVSKDEFVKNFQPPMARDGERRPEGDPARPGARRPEDNAPQGDKPRGERRAEEPGAQRPEGDRPRGERQPEGDRPQGDRPRDGERRPEGPMPGRGGPPAFFRLLDTNQDGKLSKDELAKLGEKFDELDRNHDGQLDPSELLGPPPEGRGAPARDGAGPRDANPGREGAGQREANPNPREAGQRGDNPPRDGAARGDGARREPDGAGRGAGDAPSRERGAPFEAGPFFQRLDQDNDGKISKDEAPERMKERFSMLDTNGDGFINLDEFRAGAQLLGPGNRPGGRQPEGRPDPAPKRD